LDLVEKPKEFWQVTEAGHGWISFKRHEEYEQQLIGFFQEHLLSNAFIEYT